jgi:hypothetical protein
MECGKQHARIGSMQGSAAGLGSMQDASAYLLLPAADVMILGFTHVT